MKKRFLASLTILLLASLLAAGLIVTAFASEPSDAELNAMFEDATYYWIWDDCINDSIIVNRIHDEIYASFFYDIMDSELPEHREIIENGLKVPAAEYEGYLNLYFAISNEMLEQIRVLTNYDSEAQTYTVEFLGGSGGPGAPRGYNGYADKGDYYEIYLSEYKYISLADLLPKGVSLADYLATLENPYEVYYEGYCFYYFMDYKETVGFENKGLVIRAEYNDGIVRILSLDTFEGSPETEEPLPGDVNGDGKVDIRDAASVILYVSGKPVELVNNVTDTNGDGTVDVNDAKTLLQSITRHENIVLNTGDTCEHNLIYVEGYERFCPQYGQSEYWSCPNCSKIFKDKDATVLSNLAGVALEPKHIPGEWMVGTPAGKTENGQKVIYCMGCGNIIETAIIPYTGSIGLAYTLNEDGVSYTVSGIGTCTDTEIVIPEIYEGLPVTAIAQQAFAGNQTIVSVVIPDSVNEIGYNAFTACDALKSAVISKNVKVLSSVFMYCPSLTEVVIPEGVTELDYTFQDCTSLKTVTLPSTLTKINGAFFCCTALEKIEIPASVTFIGSCSFDCCINLTEVVINGKASIGVGAFNCCSALKTVDMKAVVSIDYNAFYGCTSLERIVLPDTLTSLGEHIFEGCTALVDCFFDGNNSQWLAIKRNAYWFDSKTPEGYYSQGGRLWEDSIIILTKPEYSIKLNEDNSSYTWYGYAGGFHSRRVVLGSTYNGLPITEINFVPAGHEGFSKIYFDGTPAEWANIKKSGDTWAYETALVYYYSFKEPTSCGNYWHYVDGLPVPWSDEGRAHTVVTTPGIPATCTTDGMSEGQVCTACGFVIKHQVTIYRSGHKTVSENGKAATARTFGYTKYEYCSVCAVVITEKELILPTGIADPANYSSRWGYDYLGTLEKGEAMQAFYKALDKEAAKFHLNTYLVPDEDGHLNPVNFIDFDLTDQEAITVYTIYKDDHPLYYWIDNYFAWSSAALYIVVDEDYRDSTVRSKYNQLVYNTAAEYLKLTINETSEYRIAWALHDAICLNASYAYKSDGKTPENAAWAHNIIGILEKNEGVCESYAEVFGLLLNFCGIENIRASGLGNGGGHAWNLVELDDGEWYWYDLTWDDIEWEIHGVYHAYFAVTDYEVRDIKIGYWTLRANAFLDKHEPGTNSSFGSEYNPTLPARPAIPFLTDDTMIYDIFTYEELEYKIIGYDTAFCHLPWGSDITPPETVTYNGRTYKVVFDKLK